MRSVCAGVAAAAVVLLWPGAAQAQPAGARGPHFGVYLGVAGGGTTGDAPRVGGGVGLTGEVGFHLEDTWALSLTGGAFHSVDSSFLQASVVMHHSFADELFSVGVGFGAFTVPGQATNGVLVPVEVDFLPLFFHEGRPLFGLGVRLQIAPGLDVGTGRFALAGGLHLAALVVD